MRALVSYTAALTGSVAVGLVGFGLWLFAQAQYLEDFCSAQARLPDGPVEGHTVSGPSYASPVHFRCEWDTYADVVVVDLFPLAGALVTGVVAVGVAVILFWNAHGASRAPVAAEREE